MGLTLINLSDRSFAAYSEPTEAATEHHNPPQPQSRTAPGRLEAHDTDSEEEHFNLKKVSPTHPPSHLLDMHECLLRSLLVIVILLLWRLIMELGFSIVREGFIYKASVILKLLIHKGGPL